MKTGFLNPISNKESITTKKEVVNTPMLNCRVLFVGTCFLSSAVNMFREAGCVPAETIDDAELVVFLGGADIDPKLYGANVNPRSHWDERRDEREIGIFLQAHALNLPMFGICRGMQFLHVMAGGELVQHLENHAGSNHEFREIATGATYRTSSLHHQMCRVFDGCIPVAEAWPKRSDKAGYYIDNILLMSKNEMELEAAYYPNIRAFATQGHPEVGPDEYTKWCITKIQSLFEEVPEEQHEEILVQKLEG